MQAEQELHDGAEQSDPTAARSLLDGKNPWAISAEINKRSPRNRETLRLPATIPYTMFARVSDLMPRQDTSGGKERLRHVLDKIRDQRQALSNMIGAGINHLLPRR
ncbi:hypothetical protein [Phyllobacterium phragmitis]|uniref:Uncharacterized protein n=1 Tax=Phyllobacterium phragmitis TaxID=2670329 RepID=A0ABQ0H3F5_9HYPH